MGANPANFSQGQQIANPIYIVDTSGNQIASFGGGTQYTTGNATPASPIGTLPIFDNGGTIAKVSLAVGLPVNIVGGGGSGGTALADDAAFTAGTTNMTPAGGVYNDSVAAATSGHADTVRITSARAFHSNLRNASGTEIGTASNPVQVSLANTATNGTNVNVAVNAALPAGTNVIGSTTIQATSGTALQADQTNTILKTSLYVKTSAAADTVLALGQGAMAASLPVAIANNQGAVPVGVTAGTSFDGNAGTISANSLRTVAGGAATGTKSNVASSASSVTILASNTARKGAIFYNDSTQTCYLDLSGGTASSTSYSVQLGSNAYFEIPGPNLYNGAVTGIWAAANGNMRVTEFS